MPYFVGNHGMRKELRELASLINSFPPYLKQNLPQACSFLLLNNWVAFWVWVEHGGKAIQRTYQGGFFTWAMANCLQCYQTRNSDIYLPSRSHRWHIFLPATVGNHPTAFSFIPIKRGCMYTRGLECTKEERGGWDTNLKEVRRRSI